MRLYSAVHRVKLAMIDAMEMDTDDLNRELWEIDENLIRAELAEIERGEHLKRRKEIFEARANTGENLPSIQKGWGRALTNNEKSKGEKISSFRDAADKTGLSKSAVHRPRTRAEKITPEFKESIKDILLLGRADPAFGKAGSGQSSAMMSSMRIATFLS